MDKRAREKQKDEEIRREARQKKRGGARHFWFGGGYAGRAAAGMNRAFPRGRRAWFYDDVGDVARQTVDQGRHERGHFRGERRGGGRWGDFDSRMKAAGRAASDDEDEDEAPKSATNATSSARATTTRRWPRRPFRTCRTTEAARHRRRGRGRGHVVWSLRTPRHYTPHSVGAAAAAPQSLRRRARPAQSSTRSAAAAPRSSGRTPRAASQFKVQREEELHLESIAPPRESRRAAPVLVRVEAII